jgi:hypothetical protein
MVITILACAFKVVNRYFISPEYVIKVKCHWI